MRPRERHDERRGAPVVYRLKLPEEGEVVGKILKSVGATNFVVECNDGKQRLCTIPGRFKRRFWIKENDTVIVKPWSIQSETRGDIVWRYSLLDISKLRENKIISW